MGAAQPVRGRVPQDSGRQRGASVPLRPGGPHADRRFDRPIGCRGADAVGGHGLCLAAGVRISALRGWARPQAACPRTHLGNNRCPVRFDGCMRAVIYDPEARARLRLADVDEPVADDSEAVIEVRATALNFGEVHFIARMRKPGEVPGWDAAGVIAQAAADGSGPPVGTRVVGFDGAGGWAQRRSVPTENLAVLP